MIAAVSVISNCIATTAGRPCWIRLCAIPANGLLAPLRAPSQALSTARRVVSYSLSRPPSSSPVTSYGRPLRSSMTSTPSSQSGR